MQLDVKTKDYCIEQLQKMCKEGLLSFELVHPLKKKKKKKHASLTSYELLYSRLSNMVCYNRAFVTRDAKLTRMIDFGRIIGRILLLLILR
jgi:hypothetical protein